MIGKTPVLGIDVGEHSVKFVLLSGSPKDLLVEQFGVVEWKEKGEAVKDPFGKIRTILAAAGYKSYRTVAGVSGQTVFLRFVRLPPVPKRQMDQIVCYEAQQQVPFPIEDVRWDYQVLSAASAEERDVVLVAIKNEIAEQTMRSFTQAGLKPLVLDAAVLAIYNCLAYNQVVHPGTSSLILDIGAKTTHMIVADRGGLWVRSIPIAGNHLTQAIMEGLGIGFEEAERIKINMGLGTTDFGADNQMRQQLAGAIEKAMNRLLAEISRSLGFYRSQYPNSQLNDIYVCGGGSLLKGLDQAAKERLNLPVKRLDSLVGFKVSSRVETAALARNKVFLAGALGLALRLFVRCRLQIDLVPYDVRKQRARIRKLTYLGATYVVFFIMGLTYWAYASRLAQIQRVRTQVLDSAFRSMEVLSRGVYREKEQVEVLRSKFLAIEETLLSAQMWQTILSAVGGVLPNNFWLVRIAGERNQPPGVAPARRPSGAEEPPWGSLILEGKTTGTIDTDLSGFREALSTISFFSDVQIVSAQEENGIVEFCIKLKVKNAD